eukprot:gnl/TRDRNA2_/TRDRNA2_82451_c0_seq1.p1 gnl/TRDRNA2_/TRDRNA2_82451_c0~~gnl/TRDRNA2_/TRDRNA2_82451_c0_seq1.p1  ORF type:complete len:498 (+),score=120.39 gnl/TRDRNA2_/TRDRNA2_82451_c0_seq1:99-1592(+)
MRLLVIPTVLVAHFSIDVGAKKETVRDDVPSLTASGFDSALRKHEQMLVSFYAPWCGHCKDLAPEFSAAEKVLNSKSASPKVPLLKVDAVAETRLAERHGVVEYPTLLLFNKNGSREEYLGARLSEAIVRWVKKRTPGGAVQRPAQAADADKLMQEGGLKCISFSPEGSLAAKSFEEASLQVDDVEFVLIAAQEVAEALGAKIPSLRVHAPHDEKVFHFSGNMESATEIAAFVKDRRLPRVVPFDGDVSSELFGDGRPVLFLFRGDNSAGEAAEAALRKASAVLWPKFLLSTVRDIPSSAEQYDGRLMEFLGVTNEMLPIALLAVDPLGAIQKYRQSGDVSEASLSAMAAGFNDGSLERFVKSEKLPEADPGPVLQLAGHTMEAQVLNPAKHVVVLICAPWHGFCLRLVPVWRDLAKHFEGTEVVVAQIDATANDVYKTEIEAFPTIRLWPAGRKDQPVDFGEDQEQDLESLTRWIAKETRAGREASDGSNPEDNEL